MIPKKRVLIKVCAAVFFFMVVVHISRHPVRVEVTKRNAGISLTWDLDIGANWMPNSGYAIDLNVSNPTATINERTGAKPAAKSKYKPTGNSPARPKVTAKPGSTNKSVETKGTGTKTIDLSGVKGWKTEEIEKLNLTTNPKAGHIRVAIGLSTTSKKLGLINSNNIEYAMPFFKTLLPTFCLTRSLESIFIYKFFVTYDYDDAFFSHSENLDLFRDTFDRLLDKYCYYVPQTISLKLIWCNYTSKPAWAQNDAMLDAYLDGYDYFYRLNDDVTLASRDWTQRLIKRLRKLVPPNLGMVSPTHSGGRPNHFEFDFVHRTHIEIFGFYYPRVFLDLYADEWIANVYQ